jgi:hypothetical protein
MGKTHQPATGMNPNRTRDDNGQLRQKRADTLVGNIEREYDVDFGVPRTWSLARSGRGQGSRPWTP